MRTCDRTLSGAKDKVQTSKRTAAKCLLVRVRLLMVFSVYGSFQGRLRMSEDVVVMKEICTVAELRAQVLGFTQESRHSGHISIQKTLRLLGAS